MEQEVEPFVLPSNGYPYYVYRERVGEMEENGGDETMLISILKLNKLYV